MTYMVYIGDPLLVSPCRWMNDGCDDACNDGQCPGHVKNECCFFESTLIRYKELFIDVGSKRSAGNINIDYYRCG